MIFVPLPSLNLYLKIYEMAIKVLPAFLILTLTLTACQNDAPQSGAASSETTGTETAPAPTSTGPATDVTSSSPMLPAASQNGASAPATADAAKGTGKVNPPHGQPGHRCDIAVGAPLDGAAPASKPGATAAQPAPAGAIPAAPSTVSPKPAGSAATPTTAPGTNPPHGQPGHRCDIAVGAPLDSKPKQ